MSLAVNSVSKRYGNVWALRNVSFEVEGGSVIGLLGASGSGKTSLLKIVAGLAKPNEGSISINGTNITAIKAKERDVSYISGHQETGFIHIASPFARKHAGGEDQHEIFDEAIASARKVVLLDDPFAHMDLDQREECFAAIRKLGKMKGRVVIFATSHFQQLLSVADEAAYISNGEIIQTGAPQDLYEEPSTVEVARLTGENNLITARRLTSSDADLPEFHTIEGRHRLFAQNTEKIKLGPINQNMTLAIRPELITMSLGSSYAEENLLKSVVKAIRPMGPTSVIEFDADGLQLKTRVLKTPDLRVNDECMLGLPPHRIRILKD